MLKTMLRFRFAPHVPMEDAQATLNLARLAAASLYGDDRLRVETSVDPGVDGRSYIIDTTTQVGLSFALIFSGYSRREFGWNAVTVEHLCREVHDVTPDAPEPQEVVS